MEGWILLYRKLSDNKLWTCEQFSRGQAWVDLLLLANHDNSFFYIRGNKINVSTGQIAWGEVKLSERWRWSRTKLRKFLNDLEKEQQIIQHKGGIIQIITIQNYEEYQKKVQQTGQQKDSRKTAERQQKDIYKECITMLKKDNNVKEIEKWDEIFILWLEYKSERKEKYGKIGMDQMIKKLFKFSNNDPILAMQIIKDSIGNNYSGFFAPKKKEVDNSHIPYIKLN
jgi:hypothetical protein